MKDLFVSLATVTGMLFILYVGAYLTLGKGNFWFENRSVLRELRLEEPTAARIVVVRRHVYDPSVFIVMLRDGRMIRVCLDTDIFWNYDFVACEK